MKGAESSHLLILTCLLIHLRAYMESLGCFLLISVDNTEIKLHLDQSSRSPEKQKINCRKLFLNIICFSPEIERQK